MAVSKSRLWLAGLPVILLSALFIYFTRPDEAQAVRVVEVKREPLVSSLNTNGTVEASDGREFHTSAPGLVRRVLVKEGDVVRPGQLLMELDSGQAQAEAARTQAELEAARTEAQMVERGGSAAELAENARRLREAHAAREEAARALAANERLLAKNATPRIEVEQSRERLRQAEREVAYLEQQNRTRFDEEDRRRAQARVTSASRSVAYARQQLGSTRILAGMAGTVYSLPVRAGSFVNAGALLASIGNFERARVQAFVDEPELGRLRPGLRVLVHWDALPGEQWEGTVERLPAEVTKLGTRNVGKVVCTIDNNDRKLLANVNVDVEIVYERRASAVTVPKEAVIHAAGNGHANGGDHYVYVVEKNLLHRRAVRLGASSATRFEILSGVDPGQKVAVPGDHPLAEGIKVKEIA